MQKTIDNQNPSACVMHGDSLAVLRSFGDASFDSLVCDPPAGIGFMGQKWDHYLGGRSKWVEAMRAIFAEALRVLKPGAYGYVWALPRTAHWTMCALEDAGFLIRDTTHHVFSQGMPKGIGNVGLAIDEHLGVESEVIGQWKPTGTARPRKSGGNGGRSTSSAEEKTVEREDVFLDQKKPASRQGKEFDDYATGLKPGHEFWILVQKQPEAKISQNCLDYGVGAINIGACRVPRAGIPITRHLDGARPFGDGVGAPLSTEISLKGGWPSNQIFSHSHAESSECTHGCPVFTLVQQAPSKKRVARKHVQPPKESLFLGHGKCELFPTFYYCPKPSKSARSIGLDGEGKPITDGRKKPIDNTYIRGMTKKLNTHPTVKPVNLMRWLCRLVTPKGGMVLDPFVGSGTTLVACLEEGFSCLGIEQSEEFVNIAKKRVAHALREKYIVQK